MSLLFYFYTDSFLEIVTALQELDKIYDQLNIYFVSVRKIIVLKYNKNSIFLLAFVSISTIILEEHT